MRYYDLTESQNTTETDTMKSTAAQAAAMIRKELKKNGIAASVRSENYSMGNSVNVTLTDPMPATLRKVKEFAGQFQYGHFNSMEDIYEHSNSRKDIPQAKHVFVQPDYSDELRQAAREYVETSFCGLQGYEVDRMVGQVLTGSMRIVGGSCTFWTERKPRQAA